MEPDEVSLSSQGSMEEGGELLDLELEDADQEDFERDFRTEKRASWPESSTGSRHSSYHSAAPTFASDHEPSPSFPRSYSWTELHSARNAPYRPYKSSPDVETTPITVSVRTDLYHPSSVASDPVNLANVVDTGPVLVPNRTQPSRGAFKAMWEDPPDHASEPGSAASTPSGAAGGKCLDKVRKKLVAWSIAREQDEEEVFGASAHHSRRAHHESDDTNPSSDITLADDEPHTPPNTRKPSGTMSQSPSSCHFFLGAARSESPSPGRSPDRVTPLMQTPPGNQQEYDDFPIGAKDKAPPDPVPQRVSNLSRQFSTFREEKEYLKSHRDSVDLAHERLEAEKHDKTNPLLVSTRDSMIISKQRLERHPRSHASSEPHCLYFKASGLSPILDASPPDPRPQFPAIIRHHKKHAARRTCPEIGGHSENDEDCSIYEVERPRRTRFKASRGNCIE